ncbi:helix-turn-helix domain-containing protein [Salinibacter sp.]|uniref:helix-turn-helix domain-containing protein n=1 Tax=Salinibacter sp. TaxID=2065818 RepID=UPI003D6EAC99
MENVETTPSERNCQHRGNHDSDLEQLLAAIGRLRYQVEQLQDQLDGPEPRLLDIDQVANRLNLSERSVRSLISDGTILSTKIRRRRLVPHEALERFIEHQLEDSGRG